MTEHTIWGPQLREVEYSWMLEPEFKRLKNAILKEYAPFFPFLAKDAGSYKWSWIQKLRPNAA